LVVWDRKLSEDFDTLASGARRSLVPRVAAATVCGLVFGLNLGVTAAGLWLGAMAISEAWVWNSNCLRPDAPVVAPRLRASRLGAMVLSGIVWSVMAAAYWFSGQASLRTFAIMLIATLLTLAQSNSYKSILGAMALGVAPVVTLLLLPTLFGGFSGRALFTIIFGVLLMLVYFLHDTRLNRANAAMLRRAQQDLIAQREAAVAANQAKTSFLAMMSHELRTPMNGVLGMARALKQTDLEARQRSYVDMLLRSGDGLMTILNDILDISKIEAGKLELETTSFALQPVGQGVHDLWSEVASAKGVKLTYQFDRSAPEWVVGDPTRIRQIMLNLVSNALKFTKDGEVRLSVSAVAGQVEIAVSDTGIGIPEEKQAKLFQSFVQADSSTTRQFGGTGLGLAICKQLAELMSGDISLESRPGHGSVFRVTVPLVVAEPVADDGGDDDVLSLAGLRVLVADDNAINQAVAKATLEAAEAVITSAVDGTEVLDRLRAGSFDVILMDVHMPVMDGIEALECIRAGRAGTANIHIPIIALTADAMAGAKERLFEAGFDDVQPKPLQPAELFAAIAQACAGAQLSWNPAHPADEIDAIAG
jgi:two-component system, sensor histidine kinase